MTDPTEGAGRGPDGGGGKGKGEGDGLACMHDSSVCVHAGTYVCMHVFKRAHACMHERKRESGKQLAVC